MITRATEGFVVSNSGVGSLMALHTAAEVSNSGGRPSGTRAAESFAVTHFNSCKCKQYGRTSRKVWQYQRRPGSLFLNQGVDSSSVLGRSEATGRHIVALQLLKGLLFPILVGGSVARSSFFTGTSPSFPTRA